MLQLKIKDMNNLLKVINKIQLAKCKTGLKLAEKQAENMVNDKPQYSEIVLRSLNSKKKRLEANNDTSK